MRTVSETSGTTLNALTFEFWGPRITREKERVSENIVRDYS